MDLTVERLQSIAVGCVTQFLNKQASLSQAIAKEAQELELNSDQTKRVIEASNTVAYLRQLEKAADRTFEFPLADYSEVMSIMCIPTSSLDKQASQEEPEKEDEKKEEKEEPEDEDKEKAEIQEKKAMLLKEFFRAKSNLEKIACYKIDLHMQLVDAASVLTKDPIGLEKLAQIVEEDHFNAMTNLCGLEKRAQANVVLTDKELLPAIKVYGLYKEAKQTIALENELTDFVKRAEVFF